MGWQKHTVRGFMAGAMKKAGYTIESSKPEGGERTHRINALMLWNPRASSAERTGVLIFPSCSVKCNACGSESWPPIQNIEVKHCGRTAALFAGAVASTPTLVTPATRRSRVIAQSAPWPRSFSIRRLTVE
jgi:Protein of unknown function (DUF3489)